VTARPNPERPGDILPDAMEFAGWPPFGTSTVRLRIGPFVVELSGLDAAAVSALGSLHEHAEGDEAPGADAEVFLRVEFCRSDRPHYLEMDRGSGEPMRLQTWSEDGGALVMASHRFALLADAEAERGLACLCPQADAAEFGRSLQNCLRTALAWRLARTGKGLLLHAASVVEGEQAVLFLGPSGAGKTTAARNSAPRPVLGDDVTILLAPDERHEGWTACDSPLFADHEFPGRHRAPKRCSVGLCCSLRKSESAGTEDLTGARATVVVAAHAPFLLTSNSVFDVSAPAAALARAVPAVLLSLADSPAFWPVLTNRLKEGSRPAFPSTPSGA
jgi:hypothetical protein